MYVAVMLGVCYTNVGSRAQETEDTLMEEFGNDSKAENIHASSPKQAPTGLLSVSIWPL